MLIARRLGLALVLVAAAALVTALLFAPARAAQPARGSSILSLHLTHGDADFATPLALSPQEFEITAYEHSEWGGQVQLQQFLSDKWALALSAGIGTFSETNGYNANVPVQAGDGKYTQSSWNARVGADRFVSVSEDFQVFAGPGIEYWSGKSKFDFPVYSILAEGEPTSRISLSARIGVNTALGDRVVLNGHFGGYIGLASGEEEGAEANWAPSGNQGALGLGFLF